MGFFVYGIMGRFGYDYQILTSNGGEQFRKGYKKGLIDLRIKSMKNGLKCWCKVAVFPALGFIYFLFTGV